MVGCRRARWQLLLGWGWQESSRGKSARWGQPGARWQVEHWGKDGLCGALGVGY